MFGLSKIWPFLKACESLGRFLLAMGVVAVGLSLIAGWLMAVLFVWQYFSGVAQ